VKSAKRLRLRWTVPPNAVSASLQIVLEEHGQLFERSLDIVRAFTRELSTHATMLVAARFGAAAAGAAATAGTTARAHRAGAALAART
jgi:hypothetical protein